MRSLALVVRTTDGERFRRWLQEASLLRADLKIQLEADGLALPIRSAPDPVPEGTRVEELEFRTARNRTAPASYRDHVELPPALWERLPRAYDVVGDIVLVRLPAELQGQAGAIGAALLRFVPGARVVGVDRGVHGTERRRVLERVAGAGEFATRHRENGLSLAIDLKRAYFSPRLAREHARVAAAVRSGESVLDLCCGVGPFSLLIAREGRARSIVAVDSNPAAIELLESTARRLRIEDRIVPVLASLEAFLPSAGVADRAILNLPLEGIKYLPSVCAAVARPGTLHYYELVERSRMARRGAELLELLGPQWTADPGRLVHPYSPRSDLVAFTLRRSAA